MLGAKRLQPDNGHHISIAAVLSHVRRGSNSDTWLKDIPSASMVHLTVKDKPELGLLRLSA